jgi:hypothetical protein
MNRAAFNRPYWMVYLLAVFLSACGGSSDENTPTQARLASGPDTISLVGISSLSGDQLTLDWLPELNAQSSGLTAAAMAVGITYAVHLAQTPNFIPDNTSKKIEVVNEQTATVTNLTPDTIYYAKISATNSQNELIWSNELIFTTPSTLLKRSADIVHVQDPASQLQVTASTITYSDSEIPPNVGEILVSTLGEGHLRKVNSVVTENGKHAIVTEPAALNQVFDDLEFSTTIKSTPISQTAIQTSALVGSNLPANTHRWKSGLTLTHKPATVPTTSLTSSLTKAGDRQRYKDDYYQIEGPAFVGIKPNEISEINLTVTQHKAHDKGLKICEFGVTGITHPDHNNSDIDFISLGREVLVSNQSVRKRFTLTPGPSLIDNEGKPYIATFRVRVDDVYSGCDDVYDVDDFSIAVPIYITHGDAKLPSSIKKTFNSSLTVEHTITPVFQPEIQVNAQIKNKKLHKAEVLLTGDYNFTQDFTLKGEAGASIDVEQSLITPVQFVKVFQAGGVPIVVRGDLRLRVAIQGNITGTVDLNQQLAVIFDNSRFGFEYDPVTKTFKAIKELQKEYKLSIDGEANAHADITLKIIPDLKIGFYDAASARIRMEPYIRSDATVNGHFNYLKSSDLQGADADYYFEQLDVKGGVDVYIFAGLQIFDFDLVSWPEIDDIDAALKMEDGAFNASLFKKFSPVENTTILGLPNLNLSCDMATKPLAGDSRQIACQGSAADISNPFGGNPIVRFDEWDNAKVTNFSVVDSDYALGALAVDGTFSLTPYKLATYDLRLNGHSSLGYYIRQQATTTFSITDSNSDGLPDYWYNRYGITNINADDDNDGLSNLEEYSYGLYPTNADSDNDGMPDGWEEEHGLAPLTHDATTDRDGDGINNLAEYQATLVPILSITGASVQEGHSGTSIVNLTVTLSEYQNPVSINFATSDGSATVADNDYQAASGTLSFTGGNTSKTIAIVVQGDDTPESDETLTVTLSDPINAQLGSSSSAQISILNDDSSNAGTSKLNDTGITWGGNYSSGNNSTCSGEEIAQQDCSQGRDAQAAAGTLTKIGGGNAGFDFTKLDASGNAVSATASSWRCVKDNVTGLTWENKTTSGLHNKADTYTWYNTDTTTNGGATGTENTNITCNGYTSGNASTYCNTQAFANRVNTENLCGATDWRLPTRTELRSIVDYSRINPAIDTGYFLNTNSAYFWSSSPYAGDGDNAWLVHFYGGYDGYGNRDDGGHVRLVRGGQ